MRRYPTLFAVLALFLLASVAYADPGALELGVVQRAVSGPAFTGYVASVRVLNTSAIETLGTIDVFADAGIKLSETTETELVGGLFGISAGPRGKALRIGSGYEYPGGFTIYIRAATVSW